MPGGSEKGPERPLFQSDTAKDRHNVWLKSRRPW
jgi:hypothetical protein